MPLTNKKQTLWVLAIIKSCHFECRLEHGLVPECSSQARVFLPQLLNALLHDLQCFWVKWAFSLLWIPSCTRHKLYKNDHLTTNPWPSWKDKQMFCCRGIKLVLSAGLKVIIQIKNFYYMYNFPLIYTFNALVSEWDKCYKKQFYNYNRTLTIHLYHIINNCDASFYNELL